MAKKWDEHLFGPFKLGKTKDKDWKGIPVGPTSRKQFKSKKFKNNLPNTDKS